MVREPGLRVRGHTGAERFKTDAGGRGASRSYCSQLWAGLGAREKCPPGWWVRRAFPALDAAPQDQITACYLPRALVKVEPSPWGLNWSLIPALCQPNCCVPCHSHSLSCPTHVHTSALSFKHLHTSVHTCTLLPSHLLSMTSAQVQAPQGLGVISKQSSNSSMLFAELVSIFLPPTSLRTPSDGDKAPFPGTVSSQDAGSGPAQIPPAPALILPQ